MKEISYCGKQYAWDKLTIVKRGKQLIISATIDNAGGDFIVPVKDVEELIR